MMLNRRSLFKFIACTSAIIVTPNILTSIKPQKYIRIGFMDIYSKTFPKNKELVKQLGGKSIYSPDYSYTFTVPLDVWQDFVNSPIES